MPVMDNYKVAMRAFTALTAKVAPTLKNKGQEAGFKKLLVLMKNGKTLEQRIQDYDDARQAANSCRDDNLKALPGLLKAMDTALTKMNEGLKKNMDEYEAQAKVLGPADATLKAGFETLAQRLDALRKFAKSDALQVIAIAQKSLGKTASADEVLNKNLKMVYLGIKKGSAEFEAALKQFIAKPNDQNLQDAFCSSTAARSISVAVTHWKGTVLKTNPKIAERLRADPVHLLTHIDEAAQQKGVKFWETKFAKSKPGWEDRAKVQAKKYLDQVKNWRMMADEIKGLTQ